jgi:CheY-like chemotaxis protein/HPt (histidine-containing phosphotransfer) domain-containing protein
MGGRLWVESEPGRGSTFHFTAELGVDPARAGAARPAEPATLHDLPVLVVDDNATTRGILEEMLRSWRMRPVAAAGGRAALAEMERAGGYPLVLVDAEMPEMDGFALVEALRGDPRFAGTRAILLGSAARQWDGARWRAAGVRVHVTKPVRQSQLLNAIVTALGTAQGGAAPPPERPSASRAERSLRVLLAEDNPVNQKLAISLLEKRGHAVHAVGNGRLAVQALNEGRFDVVLMDVHMPEMGGFEATARIRDLERGTGRRTPVVALTARAMQGDRERCLEAGMDGYVPKPLRADVLFEAIERLAGGGVAEAVASPQDAPAAESAWDPANLLGQIGGDTGLLAVLAAMFVEQCPAQVEEVRAALERGDLAAAREVAHSLKGSSASLGAGPLAAAALRMERAAHAGELDGARAAWPGFRAEAERACAAMAAAGETGGAA